MFIAEQEIKPRLTLPGVEVYIGNAIDVVKQLVPVYGKKVNSVVTSPPYLWKRAYLDPGDPLKALEIGQETTIEEFITKLADLFEAIGEHLLRPDGSLWVNIGDGYAGSGGAGGDYNEGGLREGQPKWKPGETDIPDKSLLMVPERFAFEMIRRGWRLRNKIIWFKGNEPDDGTEAPTSNGMPESAEDRMRQTWEYLFHFVKEPRYFYSLDEIRESPSADSHDDRALTWEERKVNGAPPRHGLAGAAAFQDGGFAPHPLGRNPGDLVFLPTKGFPLAHFATFPPALVHRPVKATCPVAVCKGCGAPMVLKTRTEYVNPGNRTTNELRSTERRHETAGFKVRLEKRVYVEGYKPTCTCKAGWEGAILLDPFMGSGATAEGAFQARPPQTLDSHHCHIKVIGIDLDERNLSIIEKRLTGRAKQGRKVDLSKYAGGFLAAAEQAE